VILRGGRPEPPSDAFGPCFKREARSIPVSSGQKREGFEWVRVKGVPDDQCREPAALAKP